MKKPQYIVDGKRECQECGKKYDLDVGIFGSPMSMYFKCPNCDTTQVTR